MEWIVLAGILIVFGWLLLCRLEPDSEGAFGRLLRRTRVHRIQTWFCRRFSREERFGLSLTIGLIISLLAGISFGELADEILEQELLTQLDLTFGEGLLGLVSETASRTFFWITQLANPIVLLVGVVLASLWMILRGRNADVFALLAAVGGGELINQALKLLFSRPRPTF
ncbi:MAG TPA: hypothetical protein VFF68_07200, partial [Anaerolineaceae bacterium]|nr:hypothetical protein [Anaerolineaceae bacterium]